MKKKWSFWSRPVPGSIKNVKMMNWMGWDWIFGAVLRTGNCFAGHPVAGSLGIVKGEGGRRVDLVCF